jgi:hypothetical protein
MVVLGGRTILALPECLADANLSFEDKAAK